MLFKNTLFFVFKNDLFSIVKGVPYFTIIKSKNLFLKIVTKQA